MKDFEVGEIISWNNGPSLAIISVDFEDEIVWVKIHHTVGGGNTWFSMNNPGLIRISKILNVVVSELDEI